MTHLKLYLVAVVVALTAAAGYAQNSAQRDQPAAAQGAAMNHQAMMANMQAEQKKLDDLVAQMNAAKGQEKIDLMAAVLTEMASMHKGMACPMMQRP